MNLIANTYVGADEFAEAVIERSRSCLILVDFWADWCQPCHMLTPILERVIHDYGGKVALCKVDTDREQQLAMQYGIRGLPTVKLFKGGQELDSFTGVLPERAIREFIERHLERESDRVLDRAEALHHKGDTQTAIALLQQSEADDPSNDRTRLRLAGMQVVVDDILGARATLERVSSKARLDANYQQLNAKVTLAERVASSPEISELTRKLDENPQNIGIRYLLGVRLILVGEFDSGMAQLLEIVRRDRSFQDDIGRKSLLQAFLILGDDHELTGKYRSLLARALN